MIDLSLVCRFFLKSFGSFSVSFYSNRMLTISFYNYPSCLTFACVRTSRYLTCHLLKPRLLCHSFGALPFVVILHLIDLFEDVPLGQCGATTFVLVVHNSILYLWFMLLCKVSDCVT